MAAIGSVLEVVSANNRLNNRQETADDTVIIEVSHVFQLCQNFSFNSASCFAAACCCRVKFAVKQFHQQIGQLRIPAKSRFDISLTEGTTDLALIFGISA